ncbi:MAG: hypothetical protein WA147_16490 [Polaromonas sp.]
MAGIKRRLGQLPFFRAAWQARPLTAAGAMLMVKMMSRFTKNPTA